MGKYLKAVYFTLGLAVMIMVGSINALFMTPKSQWFSSLEGMCVHAGYHSAGWLVVYILMAVHVGEFIGEKHLRKYVWILCAITLLSMAWCGVFFRLYSMAGAVAVLSVTATFVVILFGITTKKTRLLALFTAPVLAWYLYLLFINIYIAILNGLF